LAAVSKKMSISNLNSLSRQANHSLDEAGAFSGNAGDTRRSEGS
jgi:hypothetical protein